MFKPRIPDNHFDDDPAARIDTSLMENLRILTHVQTMCLTNSVVHPRAKILIQSLLDECVLVQDAPIVVRADFNNLVPELLKEALHSIQQSVNRASIAKPTLNAERRQDVRFSRGPSLSKRCSRFADAPSAAATSDAG